MTVAQLGFEAFVALAHRLNCVGVECRNDMSMPLFDGMRPSIAGDLIKQAGLRLLALAEVKRFDRLSKNDLPDVLLLLDIAAAAGAEGVALIPANDGAQEESNTDSLAGAIELIAPHLEERGLVGLLEPLGFDSCNMRFKQPVIDLLNEHSLTKRFRLVHDTFHHHVAADPVFSAEHTGLVHLSGVYELDVETGQMRDPHRGLVGDGDRLDNIGQIRNLMAAGYVEPFSFEAFSPEVHADENPFEMLEESIRWIDAALLEEAA